MSTFDRICNPLSPLTLHGIYEGACAMLTSIERKCIMCNSIKLTHGNGGKDTSIIIKEIFISILVIIY